MAKIIDKYVWLVDTVRKAGDAGITFEDINNKWKRKDNLALSEGLELLKRTFHKWIIEIEKNFNIRIECERKGGYHYFISNPESLKGHDLSNWLIDTISVSQLLMQNMELKDRILLENVPSGQQFLPDIIEAMRVSHAISLTYQKYEHDTPDTHDVYPYCVKLFKQRWYMIAYTPSRKSIRTYALDRIKAVDRRPGKYQMPTNFNPAVFFKNSYGVMIGSAVPCDIKIKVDAFQANYLRSLPLHHSQQESVKGLDYSIFTYRLCPEFDFQMELLSMGDGVEVLEPASLRESIASVVRNMNEIYNC